MDRHVSGATADFSDKTRVRHVAQMLLKTYLLPMVDGLRKVAFARLGSMVR